MGELYTRVPFSIAFAIREIGEAVHRWFISLKKDKKYEERWEKSRRGEGRR